MKTVLFLLQRLKAKKATKELVGSNYLLVRYQFLDYFMYHLTPKTVIIDLSDTRIGAPFLHKTKLKVSFLVFFIIFSRGARVYLKGVKKCN